MLEWLKKKKREMQERPAIPNRIRSKDLVMWNGVDLELYVKNHDPRCLVTVMNFLELFQWDRSAEKALRYIIHKHGYNKRVTAVKTRSRSMPKEEPWEQAREDEKTWTGTVPMGPCPRCGGWVMGDKVASCETQKTDRVSYKMCEECTYYSEVFRIKDGKKLIEIEGGE